MNKKLIYWTLFKDLLKKVGYKEKHLVERRYAQYGYVYPPKYHDGGSLSTGWFAKMTNQRLPNLLLVIDRLFIQMNADYRGGVFNAGAS